MSDSLASKSKGELLRVGQRICRSHDGRWIVLWAYNVHRLFRPRFRDRQVWTRLDDLIAREWDWHLGSELFHDIRQETLTAERSGHGKGEYAFLCLGEVTAKCISNASWKPGLFDADALDHVPVFAFEIATELGDSRQSDFLHHHFMGLFQHEQSKTKQG